MQTGIVGIVLLALIQQALGLHFYLGGDKERCFYQDLPQNTILATQHNAWELEESSGNWVRTDSLAIQIRIEESFDNNHRVAFQKLNAKGDFVFTAADSGEHRICYKALSGSWYHPRKVKMDIDFAIGEGSSMDSKNTNKITNLAERVQLLNNKLVLIRREQSLLREREMLFRDTSEETNSRVVKWTFIQLLVLGATCAWQLNHLRSFFVKQKLV